jgi:hypothetical protein
MTTTLKASPLSNTRQAVRQRTVETLQRNAAILVAQNFACCVLRGLPCEAAGRVANGRIQCAMIPKESSGESGPQHKTREQALACTNRKERTKLVRFVSPPSPPS